MNILQQLFQQILTCTLIVILLFVSDTVMAEEGTSPLVATEHNWAILTGYGITHNGMGKTQLNVETVDFVVGYEKRLTDTMGEGLLKGRHSFIAEIPVHFVVDPWEDPMFGVNFLARWTFESDKSIKPYIFGGGGPVYTDAKIRGLGAHMNGNWQFGVGMNVPAFKSRDFIVEYRFHHISNLNTKTPNDSLNSSKVLVGMRF